MSDTETGLFGRFGGPAACIYQKLVNLLIAIYPHFDGDIYNEVSTLRAKNQFRDIPLESASNTTNARQIMKN